LDSAKVIPSKKLMKDLDFLSKTIEEVHPNPYAYTSEVEFAKHREKLYGLLDHSMGTVEFYKLVAPAVASLRNGHTNVFPPFLEYNEHLKKGGRTYQLPLDWDEEKLFVIENKGFHPLPAGAIVLEINGEDASSVIMRMAQYFPAERRDSNPYVIVMWLPIFLWIEYGDVESLKLKIKSLNGHIMDYEVMATEPRHKEASKPDYSYRLLPEVDAGLIEFNKFSDLDKFKEFLNATFGEIREKKVSDLIIDIRANPGGSSTLGDLLLEYLTDKPFCQIYEMQVKISPQARKQRYTGELKSYFPDGTDLKSPIITVRIPEEEYTEPRENPLRFNGRVYLLIGPKSASSSVGFANAIKYFKIGTLIGEETLDPITCYGDCLRFTLPNSQLTLNVAHKYFILPGGTNDGRGVLPDYEVRQEPEDRIKGIDTVLQFTLDLMR